MHEVLRGMLASRVLSLSKIVVHSRAIYASQRQKQQVCHLWDLFNRPTTSKRFSSKSRSICEEWVREAPKKRTGVSRGYLYAAGLLFNMVWQLRDFAVDPFVVFGAMFVFVSVNVVSSHTSN